METFTFADITLTQWILALFCGILIGMAKTGLAGLGMFVVIIMASIFGGKSSTGILLIILVIIAVMFAEIRMRKKDLLNYV